MFSKKQFLTGVLAAACLARAAAGQEIRPSGVQLKEGDWTLVPIVSQSSIGWAAQGVLALRDKQNAVGDNIVAIWYERAPDRANEWSARSWTSQNQWDAINYSKRRFGISDLYDFMWPTSDAHADALLEAPVPYFNGLLVSDPMAEITASPQRDEILLLLTQVGYQAASVDFEQDGACTGLTVLTALCDAAVLGASAAAMPEELERLFASEVPESCPRVAAPSPPAGMLPGTRVELPGLLIDPASPWKRIDRPPAYNPQCSTLTSCCYSAPIVCFYWREGMFGLRYLEFCEATVDWTCPNPEGEICPPEPACPPQEITPTPGSITCGHAVH